MLDQGELQERVISIDRLADYEEVYLINSLRGKIAIELVS
jgi:branched-subunit amino acid aminotransferase/4-amino-4-deoxychorismate lyase